MSMVQNSTKLARGKKHIDIDGSFAPAGTGAVTAPKGAGFTVARTDVGEFTVTFESKYVDLVKCGAWLQLAAAADHGAQCGAYDASAGTLIIRTQVGATETDVAANANNRVNFSCTFSDMQAPG